jgi:hypothetical protein
MPSPLRANQLHGLLRRRHLRHRHAGHRVRRRWRGLRQLHDDERGLHICRDLRIGTCAPRRVDFRATQGETEVFTKRGGRGQVEVEATLSRLPTAGRCKSAWAVGGVVRRQRREGVRLPYAAPSALSM